MIFCTPYKISCELLEGRREYNLSNVIFQKLAKFVALYSHVIFGLHVWNKMPCISHCNPTTCAVKFENQMNKFE